MCGSDIFLAILAILFPPVAVWVKRGICSGDSLINLALCCLGLLPGLLHAWYIIWSHPDPGDEYERVADSENGNVTYYYVAHTSSSPTGGRGRGQPKRSSNNQQYRSHVPGPSYGAVPSQQFHGQQSGVANPWAEEGRSAAKQGSSAPSPPPGGPSHAADDGEGSASQPPPTYAEAVRGDHKVQSHD